MVSNEINVKFKLDELLKQVRRKEKEEKDFIDELSKNTNFIDEEIEIRRGSLTIFYTYLQHSCLFGHIEIAKWLLENGANVTKTGRRTSQSPLELTCMKGYAELLDSLLDHPQVSKENEMILKSLVPAIQYVKEKGSYKVNRSECLKKILNKIEKEGIDINKKCGDNCELSPLFYALYCADIETVLKILQLGASLADVDDDDDTMMVELLTCEVLEKNLDNSVKVKVENSPLQISPKVVFDFTTLLPQNINKQNLESDVIFYISSDSKFQYLLSHPLILCFLFMKWRRISLFFLFHMGICILQAMFMCGFVISLYKSYDIVKNIFCMLIGIMCGIQIGYHGIVSYWYYVQPKFKNVKCWKTSCLKLVLPFAICIGLCIFDLVYKKNGNVDKVFLSAIIIMQSLDVICTLWIKWIYGQMLKVVFLRFCKLLLSYFIIIIAFTISHYVTYTENQDSENGTLAQFFKDIAASFCKTFLFMIGELSDADIDKTPVLLNFVLLFFVFVFSIVFINLLNGLAVYDIGKLLETAEMTTHQQTIQYIHSVETFLSGLYFSNYYATIFKPTGASKTIEAVINANKNTRGVNLDKNFVQSLNKFAARNKLKIYFNILSCIVTSELSD